MKLSKLNVMGVDDLVELAMMNSVDSISKIVVAGYFRSLFNEFLGDNSNSSELNQMLVTYCTLFYHQWGFHIGDITLNETETAMLYIKDNVYDNDCKHMAEVRIKDAKNNHKKICNLKWIDNGVNIINAPSWMKANKFPFQFNKKNPTGTQFVAQWRYFYDSSSKCNKRIIIVVDLNSLKVEIKTISIVNRKKLFTVLLISA
eukprot:65400_1